MKAKYLAIPLLGIALAACGSGAQKSDSNAVDDSAADSVVVAAAQPEVDTPVVEEEPIEESTTEADIELIKQFYKKCVFGSSSPKKYCTQKCLKKLAAAYDYDDGGYAVWEFRTDNQDGDGPSKVTDVQPDGDGWYTVSYRDMGAKGVTKVLVVDGKIDGYKRVS